MDFKTISDTENQLFNRREIEGEIHAEVTPSREQVTQLLSEKFSSTPETIKIRTIKGKFGSKVFLIVANIYKSKEDKDKVELKKKKDVEREKKQAQPEQPVETEPVAQEQKVEEPVEVKEGEEENANSK